MRNKPNRTRTTQINIRLKDDEKQLIDKFKDEKNLTLTGLILKGIEAMKLLEVNKIDNSDQN